MIGAFLIMMFIVSWLMNLFSFGVLYLCWPSLGKKLMFAVMPILMTFLFIGAMFGARRFDSQILSMLSGYWLGSLFIFFAVAAVLILVLFILSVFKIFPSPLWARGVVCIALALIATAVISGQRAPQEEHVTIKSAKLPVESIKIVQISDTHLGYGVPEKRVEKLVKQINSLNADFVFVTGDFLEDRKSHAGQYAAILKNIKAKYGVYGSLGNHEYYSGLASSIDFYEMSGVKLLRQETVEPLAGVQVVGIDDIHMGAITSETIDSVMSQTGKNKFVIVMEHEPATWAMKELADKGAGLILAGHTHNGQIFPFNFLVKMRYPYSNGLYEIGNGHLFVTSGTFFWGPPMRLFTKNEIAVITVERE
ncbi:hypothetical protein Dip518_001082 [Parelusimicrobium proximum]|uniref:metallophosphoesterase n=1 Tax=Parelusimicrobium proximum TaxID=3228953 RepID=UPI003D182DE1